MLLVVFKTALSQLYPSFLIEYLFSRCDGYNSFSYILFPHIVLLSIIFHDILDVAKAHLWIS